jgi:Lrp/AsnC family transcriptional regulator, leucine-responsive regulatory protein
MMADRSDLDSFDLRLLEMLQADARTPVPVLAEAVGLSAPACYRRIRRLRESRAIEREVAVVRPKTLGWGLSMIVLLVMEREGNRTVRDLIAEWSRVPEVIEVWNVTGDYDFAVRMVARDMEDYGDLAERLFSSDERIRSFKTLVVIRGGETASGLPAAG